MRDSNVPILGKRPTLPPSELVHAGSCPICDCPIFAHTGTPSDPDPAVFTTCSCVFTDTELAVPKDYDPERERQTVAALFESFHALTDLTEELLRELEEVNRATGVAEG